MIEMKGTRLDMIKEDRNNRFRGAFTEESTLSVLFFKLAILSHSFDPAIFWMALNADISEAKLEDATLRKSYEGGTEDDLKGFCLVHLEHILESKKEDKEEARETPAWTPAMEEDFMKKGHPDVIRQQQTSNVDKGYSETKRVDSGPNGCVRCCMSTKNCLMSPECGRALSIASVISMCGMCIRMWTWTKRVGVILVLALPKGDIDACGDSVFETT
ncbi:hypothetical protein C0J45_12678 [Silurus meridionalis]|nr:hypothetical protein C0J45_12678 [Silurus meridionalis]